jgi:ankyrin repeat domain-containing protein 17
VFDLLFDENSGNTPLMYACAGGHLDVVEILLQSGANVEDHNENGHTPLMEAASAGYVNVAKVLLENGAGINTHSNEFKESALTLACYKGHLEMVRFLLAAGADQVSDRCLAVFETTSSRIGCVCFCRSTKQMKCIRP